MKNRILGLMMVVVAAWLFVGTAQARLTPYAKSLYGRKSELRLDHSRRNTHHYRRAAKFYPPPTPSEIDSMVTASADQYQIN